MNTKRFTLLLLLLLAGSISHYTRAQSFDHESYPTLNFDVGHMDLELVLNQEGNGVQGTVSYRMSANVGGINRIAFNAAHMQIKEASVNNSSTEFSLSNDTLFVELADGTASGGKYNVSISYETLPRFGLFRNNLGTVWTSLLPRSVRHWVPVIDHPRVSFSSNIKLTVPSGYEAAAPGMQMDRRALDVDNVIFTFRTETEVPASSLTFAAGRFNKDQSSFGLKRITLLSELELLSQEERHALIETATGLLKEVQDNTDRDYPFEGLSIVVLKDHYWETKSWGASTIYLYANKGNLEAQLRRGIYGQWFGVFQREEQWQDAEATNLYQTALHYRLTDQEALFKSQDEPIQKDTTVYSVFDASGWNRLQTGFPLWSDSTKKEIVTRTVPDVLRKGGGVYTWDDYARFWYERTGQPYFDNISIPVNRSSGPDSSDADSIRYSVVYSLDEQQGKLKLRFKAEQGMFDELVTLPLIEVNSDQADTSEVTFTGRADSVVVNVSPMVQNVHIDASSRTGLYLDQYKPASFLIYTLRSGNDTGQKKMAAEKLGSHSENPDLQLAIRDFLTQENLEPEVRAALLNSFADITKGAAGTEQLFVDALASDHPAVQQSGLSALRHFTDNESVRESVKSFALKADSLPVFKKAVEVYSIVADTTAFENFIRQIVPVDTAGYRAIHAIRAWADGGQPERAVSQAEFYVSETYDYPVRAAALKLLMEYDHTPEDWRARVERLLNDDDPRIRYLVVQGLPGISGLEPSELLAPRIEDEYDARVNKQMREVVGVRSEE